MSSTSHAQETVSIAVAANFLATLKSISKDFKEETGIKVAISNGSSGMLYAQIKRGAPYDMFFSADAKRPQLLEEKGFVEEGSRFTYVVGNLVAWSPDSSKVSPDLSQLKADDPNLRFIAIANPRTAPYGMAAVEVLKYYGLYDKLKANNQIAIGGNVGKAFHFAVSGNAQISLIAKSYLSNPNRPMGGVMFDIPSHLYPKLIQQAVVLKGRYNESVRAFIEFFHSKHVQDKIQLYGYGLGDNGQGS